MRRFWLAAFVLALLIPGELLAGAPEVVVYTSVDQVFAQPILEDYEKETGVRMRAVYDVEASKTTGLVNRLIAEKRRPKADVFWNSEIVRTIQLQKAGVLAPYKSPESNDIPDLFKDKNGYWTGFAARARVLIWSTKLLTENTAPKSIYDFTKPRWKGRFALAYPLFGTTSTQMAAMYQVLGQKKTEDYLRAIKNNGVVIVDGNGVCRDVVAEGRLPVAFTDTDDATGAVLAGKPVKFLYPDKDGLGTLLIPNTVGLVAKGPNTEEGKKFIDWLLSERIESRLAFSESANMPVRPWVNKPAYVPSIDQITPMDVDYEKMVDYLDPAMRFCQQLFVR